MQDEIGGEISETNPASMSTSGEWIVASLTKPLTEGEAEKVVVAYQTIQELIARGSD
jgi:hypothetical protein